MIRKILNLEKVTPLNRQQIEHLVRLAQRFEAHILFIHKNREINGRSILGLLTMGSTGKDDVILQVEGNDEETAADAIERTLISGIEPPKDAADAEQLLLPIKDRYVTILSDNLIGIYLYGTLADGCFQWEYSNINIITVVRKSPSDAQKIALIETLYSMSNELPPHGINMTVLLGEHLRQPPYPMPYELHYENTYKSDYEHNPGRYCQKMHGRDTRLTLDLLSVSTKGICLIGTEIQKVFSAPRRADVISAWRERLVNAENLLHECPVYYILSMCKALAYIRNRLYLSMINAGKWAMKNMPSDYQPLIQAAINAYDTGNDMFYDRTLADDFCYDAMQEINSQN